MTLFNMFKRKQKEKEGIQVHTKLSTITDKLHVINDCLTSSLVHLKKSKNEDLKENIKKALDETRRSLDIIQLP